MRFLFNIMICLVCFSGVFASSNDPQNDAFFNILVEQKIIPDFAKYPAPEFSSKDKFAKKIDFNSHPGARKYRTSLKEGFRKIRRNSSSYSGNFAGHFCIITCGCGSDAQINWIIDLKSGKVIDCFYSNSLLYYRSDSTLIVVGSNQLISFSKAYPLPTIKNLTRDEAGKPKLIDVSEISEEKTLLASQNGWFKKQQSKK